MRAIQFMNSVSQPIIAATNQLVIYPPFLGGYLLSNFIQPVYRLSKAPVSDETPFAGGSPAITASQACRQLSQLCRLFASDLQLRLLRRNLSLVASDRQLRGFRAGFGCHSPDDRLLLRWGAGAPQSLVDSLSSLSRELVDAGRFSSDLQGANRPPSQRPGVSSHRQRFAAAAAGPSVSWRQPYAFAPDQPTSNSSGRSFRQGGWLPPP